MHPVTAIQAATGNSFCPTPPSPLASCCHPPPLVQSWGPFALPLFLPGPLASLPVLLLVLLGASLCVLSGLCPPPPCPALLLACCACMRRLAQLASPASCCLLVFHASHICCLLCFSEMMRADPSRWFRYVGSVRIIPAFAHTRYIAACGLASCEGRTQSFSFSNSPGSFLTGSAQVCFAAGTFCLPLLSFLAGPSYPPSVGLPGG